MFGGDIAIVGDKSFNENRGRAHIFEKQPNGNWLMMKVIEANNPVTNDYFGSSVAIADGVAIVGAPYDDDALSRPESGSAYIFARDGSGGGYDDGRG